MVSISLSSEAPSRLEFSTGVGLYGFPTSGGVYLLSNPHPVLLDHLGIDRFTATATQRKSDSAAEDAFCASIRKIGAVWWPSIEEEAVAEMGGSRMPIYYVYTGWPKSGGMWFMRLRKEETYSMQLGMLRMALTMDEYCRVLETNGAQFFADYRDCDYFKDEAFN